MRISHSNCISNTNCHAYLHINDQVGNLNFYLLLINYLTLDRNESPLFQLLVLWCACVSKKGNTIVKICRKNYSEFFFIAARLSSTTLLRKFRKYLSGVENITSEKKLTR